MGQGIPLESLETSRVNYTLFCFTAGSSYFKERIRSRTKIRFRIFVFQVARKVQSKERARVATMDHTTRPLGHHLV